MPSTTPKQARFMRAIAHGWKPKRLKHYPSRAVAREFVEADKKYSGGFAENRYQKGGLAAMNEVDSTSERARPLRYFQGGGEVWTPWGPGTESNLTPEEQAQRDAFLNLDINPGGFFSTALYNIQQQNLPAPEPTIASPTGYAPPTTATYTGPRFGPRGGRRGSGFAGRRFRDEDWSYGEPPEIDGGPGGGGPGPGGGPGGPGTVPPRIIPTDPASYVGASSDVSGRESPYREQLRQHQARVANIFGTGSARGGHVKYYQEGGAVRPGHAEGPNPFPEGSARYRLWERENHIEPAPPPPAAPPPTEIPWWKKLMGYGSEESAADIDRLVTEAETGEARGGRVGYQYGGLAAASPATRISPPAGGVPPWIEPVGSGPGYGEEPQGYQFGGGVPYRGVPPQRGGIVAGPSGPYNPGGGMMNHYGMMGRFAPPLPQRGGLAAIMQQMQAQRGMQKPMPGPSGPYNPGPMPQQIPADFWQPGGGVIGKPRPAPGTFPPGGIVAGGPPPGGGIPPWKQLPGDRPQVPPSPGDYMGGARVPPNLQGYLQQMRMMNRPPAMVGRGVNRVGQGDQQGALARALQRGTGRPPMSRRQAFGVR